MKFGKKVGSQVSKTLSKGKKYAWRVIFIITIGLGIFLIGRPMLSLTEIRKEISLLEKEKSKYKEIVFQNNTFIESLENDEFLEQYAREKYFMQGKNEQVFIVE